MQYEVLGKKPIKIYYLTLLLKQAHFIKWETTISKQELLNTIVLGFYFAVLQGSTIYNLRRRL